MSDPTEPGKPVDPDDVGGTASDDPTPANEPAADDRPTQAYEPAADDQPTQAYAPAADDQPTQAHTPAADDQATQAYAPDPPAEPPTQAYAPAAYPGAPPPDARPADDARQPVQQGAVYPPAQQYAQPPGAALTDSRPRTLAIVAIIAAIVGVLLCLGGFIPIPVISTALVIIGGVLLLIGLIFSLVVLFSKKQGAKPLGIAAVIIAVLGGILFVVALIVSLLWIGLANALSNPTPTPAVTSEVAPSATPSDEATTEPSEPAETTAPDATGTYDEAAYLAAVRPEITAIMQEIQPEITEDQLNQIYSDETLLALGQAFTTLDSVGGTEVAREQFITSLVESGASEEQAGRFFDTISNAANQYLVQ